MKILVTGGNGYLGSKISHHLHNIGYDVTSLTRNKIHEKTLEHKIKIINWDDLNTLLEAVTNIDVVIHTAGMNYQNCEIDPIAALNFNGKSTLDLINASISKGVKKFIYLSTIQVYNSRLEGVIDEKSNLMNFHPYATSHVAGESYVINAAKNNTLDGVVLRLSNVFGKPTTKNIDCWDLLINNLCKQAVENNKLLLKSDGFQYRNFLPITNLCNVIANLLKHKSLNKFNSLINLGSNDSYKVIDITKLVQERYEYMFGLKVNINLDHLNKTYSNDFKFNSIYSFEIDKYKIIEIKDEIDDLLKYCKYNFS